MQILKQGAEAILYLESFEGQDVIVKERIEKKYRIKEIDTRIRKTRTKQEVRLLNEARRCGVLTPKILDVDDKSFKIIMEHIAGTRVKELLNDADEKTIENICIEIGRMVGKLHEGGIVHGDLTTSNMILKGDKIYFIDFGLGSFSTRIEDQGTDLKLLFEALKSTHFKVLKLCWKNIVSAYKKQYKDADKVLERVDVIEKRARYAKR